MKSQRLTLSAVVLAFVVVVGSSNARAGWPIGRGRVVSGPVVTSTAPYYGRSAASLAPPVTFVPPYSYYLAPVGHPARTYVGYGNDDFPFHGQIYGQPYDPWTWVGLSR